MIKKVSRHIVQEEPLLFELSSPGKAGYQLPDLDVPPFHPNRFSARKTFATRSRDSRKLVSSKRCAISPGCRPGTMRSIWVCILSAPAR